MAKLCDVYVNDALAPRTARKRPPTDREVRAGRVRAAAGRRTRRARQGARQPGPPLVAIVAGSKVSTKLTILKSLAGKVDQLIVGGGIANTFMLAAGLSIGKSLAEADLVNEAKAIIDEARERGASVPIPTDVVTAKEFRRRPRPR